MESKAVEAERRRRNFVGTMIDTNGRHYRVHKSGAIGRIDLKPWRNKAERKQWLRLRRDLRGFITAPLGEPWEDNQGPH